MLNWILVGLMAFAPMAAEAPDAEEVKERIQKASKVMDEIMSVPEKGIPRDLLAKANCVAVIPGMKKGGFIVGAKYGKGVVTCRGDDGSSGWTAPSTVRVEGGSFGLQIGGTEIDLVLLVMNDSGKDSLMDSEFTLGGEAAVAAGPVGRSAQAETDAWMRAHILSYSRSRGVFAGLALEGATLRSDDDDNEALYGHRVTHKELLNGHVPVPAAAQGFIGTLNKYSARESGNQ